MDKQTTVTVSVLTYNSSKYVLETLESIKAQTYPNLILHICDDCSTDNTIDICRKWIERNKERFVSTDIIVPECNTGVSANANRAWDACTTRYNKDIAGDDILLPNCIEDNLTYAEEHPKAVFIFSKLKAFGVDEKMLKNIDFSENINFFRLSQPEQRIKLRIANYLQAPTSFVNLEKARQLNLRHDERIPMIEDYPLWLKASSMGVLFHFIDVFTVKYRINDTSLSFSNIPSKKYLESLRLIDLYYKIDFTPENDELLKDIFVYEQCIISKYVDSQYEINQILNSRSYKLGNFLLRPISKLKEVLVLNYFVH